VKREEILAVYNEGPEAVVALVEGLIANFERIYQQQALQITILEARVKQLENQLNQNSRNSSKPPSSDGFKRTKSLRAKSGKKSGGQKGHPGHTLKMVDSPDQVQVHTVDCCRECGASLADQAVDNYERRQVFDIPPLKLLVTEHRAEMKTCQVCGACNKVSFPERVTQLVQYGPEVQALAVYLNQYQLLPYDRIRELFADLFGHLTYYSIQPKRGSDAMDEMGILPVYKGIAKHDFWKAYLKYLCDHSLCNAHHLRELTAIVENENQALAQQMKALLLDIKAAVDKQKENSKTHLELEQLMDFESRFQRIIALGYEENPLLMEEDFDSGSSNVTMSMWASLGLASERHTLPFKYFCGGAALLHLRPA